MHELGHIFGFTRANLEFEQRIEQLPSGLFLVTDDVQIPLDPSGNEVDAMWLPDALMAGNLRPGSRKLLSDMERSVFMALPPWQGVLSTQSLGFLEVATPPGFVALADALAGVSDPNSGLTNPEFHDRDFGWATVGQIEFGDGIATIVEGEGLISSVSQTFILPNDAESISFTFKGELNREEDYPPDTFEVALLDASTSVTLSSELNQLSGGDASLNVQSDGRLRFSEHTIVHGIPQDGTLVELAEDVRVTMPIADEDKGKAVTLYFDLIGFGEHNSAVTIGNVQLNRSDVGEFPRLSFALDPNSDSGIAGDNITNQASVTIVGSTDPGVAVSLDINQDEVFDFQVVADSIGQFQFTDIELSEGSNVAVFAATNESGATTRELSISLDTQPPAPMLLDPQADSVITTDPGFVQVSWNDPGASALERSTIDPSDLQVTSADIKQVDELLDGTFNYRYDELVSGNVSITFPAGVVQDTAGNLSNQAQFDFRFDPNSSAKQFFGPTPYLSVSDTPVDLFGGCSDCLVALEDFEDEQLDTRLIVNTRQNYSTWLRNRHSTLNRFG